MRLSPYGSDNSVNGFYQEERGALYSFHYRQTLSIGWYLAQVMLSTWIEMGCGFYWRAT
jgi:hypothetical protein